MAQLADQAPAAIGLFWATALAWTVSELRIMYRNRGGTGENLDQGSRVWVVLLVAAGMGAALALTRSPFGRAPGWPPMIAGLALAVSGIVLRQWSVSTLGAFFTTAVEVQADHRIVDRGPYARLRHPAYTGALLTVVGLSLTLGNLVGCLVATSLTLVGLGQRIRIEERALSSQVGEPWYAYARTRKRLVPFVW